MASATTDVQPLRPAKMFKYGTFSRLFGGASSKKADDTDADATASVSEQQPPQQQPPSAEAAAAAPAAASAAAPAKSARPKCLRISLIVMFSSGVILAVGLLAGLLTRHTHAADSDNSTANATGRPNIVFIMTDDQDRRLGSTDYQEVLHRELIQKGVEFSNHYTTQALCCPARSSLLRGQQIHNTNITNVVKPGYATLLQQVSCARA